jgi:cytochrome P450
VDGRSYIPTCPYKFPDGKGSTKFLDGETVSREWARKYGSVYRIWTGLKPEMYGIIQGRHGVLILTMYSILTRPDDIKAVYRDSDTHFKAGNVNAGWVLGELIGDGVGLLSSSDWKRVHAVVAPPFAQKATAYASLVMSRVQRHFAAIEQSREQQRLKPLHLKPTEDLNSIPFWVLSDIVYGELPGAMNEELAALIDLRNQIWAYTFKGGWSLLSIHKHCSPTVSKKLQEFEQRWEAFNDQAHDHILAKGTVSLPIVSLHQAVQEGRVKRSEVLHSIGESLFTNIDVTMGTFAWIAILLAVHPEIQNELRQEITEARQKGTTEAWHRYVTSNSTLLACCILESGRLRPIANYTYPQYLQSDRVVGGYLIPRGTYFIVDTNALNRRDPGWGLDGDQFRPRRFMGTPASEFRYRLWRFGFGPRQCLAQALADTMLKCLVVYLIEKYKVSIPEALVRGKEDWKQRKPDTWFSMAENGVLCEEI